MSQADELDFTRPGEEPVLRPNFEISKLLAIIDFALASAADPEENFLGELGLAPPDDIRKRVNGVFQFEVKSGSEKQVRPLLSVAGLRLQHWYADMKKAARIRPGMAKAAGLKPDVTLIVSDKVLPRVRVEKPADVAQDMVALALGQLSPQKAFLQGKVRVRRACSSAIAELVQVKGNLLKGLSMNQVLNAEVGKLSKL